jgi:hypothetical protein
MDPLGGALQESHPPRAVPMIATWRTPRDRTRRAARMPIGRQSRLIAGSETCELRTFASSSFGTSALTAVTGARFPARPRRVATRPNGVAALVAEKAVIRVGGTVARLG